MKIVTLLLVFGGFFFSLFSSPCPVAMPGSSSVCPIEQTLYVRRHNISIQTWEHYSENGLYRPTCILSTSLQDWALLQERSSAWLVPLLKDARGDVSRNRHINSCILFLAFCLLTGSCWPMQTAYTLLTKQVWLVCAATWKQSSVYLQ